MSGLKQLRLRVRGIKATQKVTKAMQLVAAAKLKRARLCISETELYSDTATSIVCSMAVNADLLASLSKEKSFFFADREKPILLVLFTSERGLCGSFNASITRYVKQRIEHLLNQQKQVKLVIIGKKGYDALKNSYAQYIEDYIHLSKDNRSFVIYQLQHKIFELITSGIISDCRIYFNKFYSAMSYKVIEDCLIPIINNNNDTASDYDYEGAGCIANAVNLYINGHLNYALVNSIASEEGARMMAMDSATKNANKIVNELTLKLNRTRQALITKELVEIISGAELM